MAGFDQHILDNVGEAGGGPIVLDSRKLCILRASVEVSKSCLVFWSVVGTGDNAQDLTQKSVCASWGSHWLHFPANEHYLEACAPSTFLLELPAQLGEH